VDLRKSSVLARLDAWPDLFLKGVTPKELWLRRLVRSKDKKN